MRVVFPPKAFAIAFFSSLIIVGCGGGSGTGSVPEAESSSPVQPASTQSTVTQSTVNRTDTDSATVSQPVETHPVVEVEEEPIDTTVGESSDQIRPNVTLTSPSNGTAVDEDSNLKIRAQAWDKDGDIDRVTFYINNAWVGRDTQPPYEFTWRDVEPGRHKVYVIAHDNADLTAKSAVHFVTVGDDDDAENSEPEVTLTGPSDLSNLVAGSAVTLTAEAEDEDGSITKVDFFANGEKLGSDFNAPYEFRWSAPSVGSYDLHAVATDDAGLRSESDSQRLTVVESTTSGRLATYPVTDTLSALHKSGRFAVSVSQGDRVRSSFVYKEDNSSDVSWAGNCDYMQTANHWTTFSFEGAVQVEARR